jgi:hypothetical protein
LAFGGVISAIGSLVAMNACKSSDAGDDNSADAAPEVGPLKDAPTLDDLGNPVDTGTQDPSFDDFEDPGGCGGWQSDGVTLTWRQPGAHGSNGSCEICIADAGGGVAYKLVPLTPGSYAMDALVLRLDGGTGDASWNESLAFSTPDGTDAGYITSSGPLTDSYSTAELTASTADGTRVVMRIGKTGGNDDCFLVDDIRLAPR